MYPNQVDQGLLLLMNALAYLKLIWLLYSGVIGSCSSVLCWTCSPKLHQHNQGLAAPWLLQRVPLYLLAGDVLFSVERQASETLCS